MKKINDTDFSRVFNEYYKLLFRIAYSYTLNTFDTEDVLQEVFIKFYIAHKIFKNNLEEKYWLIRVTINQCLDYIKKKKKHEIHIDNEYINNVLPCDSDVDEKDEKNKEIYECVCSLKNSYKTIIILYFYDNYSIKEIASILKISESNVTTRLSRAKKKLKKIIIERGSDYGR